MRRTIEVETSFFDTRPKRWSYGSDCYVLDLVIEYDDDLETSFLDGIDDDDLLEMADNGDERVKIISGW